MCHMLRDIRYTRDTLITGLNRIRNQGQKINQSGASMEQRTRDKHQLDEKIQMNQL